MTTKRMVAPQPLPRVDYPSDVDPQARAAYAVGLRHLADVIEAHPECPLPSGAALSFFLRGDDSAQIAADLRRAFGGGRWKKRPSVDESDLILEGMCAGLPINLWLNRDQVCERVVVGTEEVTEVIPAVTEADLRPEQTITRTVEHIQWVCSPLLGLDEPAKVAPE